MRPSHLFALCAVAASPSVTSAVETIGHAAYEALDEISGIVKSSYGDFYWVHNDSGDLARLFAVDADFNVLKPPYLRVSLDDWEGHAIDNASHFDWEDIALADGVLYIADVGNNGNARRDLGVYVVNEPHPLAVPRMKALKYLPVRYPDQNRYPGEDWHFDCEAVFVSDGRLYFITKHRQSGRIDRMEAGAKLYRLDTAFTDRENVLTLTGRRDDVVAATGADISPDGTRLAVATYTALWLFDQPSRGDDWFSGKAWKLELERDIAKQLEAIAWEDDSTLRLVNEQRDVLRSTTAEFLPLP